MYMPPLQEMNLYWQLKESCMLNNCCCKVFGVLCDSRFTIDSQLEVHNKKIWMKVLTDIVIRHVLDTAWWQLLPY